MKGAGKRNSARETGRLEPADKKIQGITQENHPPQEREGETSQSIKKNTHPNSKTIHVEQKGKVQ